jgi:hypothetical protein
MDLGVGEVFGEDLIVFGIPNTYGVKVESTTLTVLTIERDQFNKKYKKMILPL